MAFIVCATWKARPGTEKRIEQILAEMVQSTRQEPGCMMYQPHRSLEDPTIFLLYEQYADRAAFDAHMASDYFKRLVLGEAVSILESRKRELYSTLEFGSG